MQISKSLQKLYNSLHLNFSHADDGVRVFFPEALGVAGVEGDEFLGGDFIDEPTEFVPGGVAAGVDEVEADVGRVS